MDEGWSLEELAERVAGALAVDDVRAPNGRVRERPDARAIRWYATIGLVDRPHVGRRRAGRYGPRHLLQVVAVKRRQAEGRSLAEIQAELAGATDEALRAVARVPEALLADAPPLAEPVPRPRFWAAAPAAGSSAPPVERVSAPDPVPSDGRLDPVPSDGADDAVPATVRYVIPLAAGVTLMLPAAPTDADLAAIRGATAPLIDLLSARGLTLTKEHPDDRSAH